MKVDLVVIVGLVGLIACLLALVFFLPRRPTETVVCRHCATTKMTFASGARTYEYLDGHMIPSTPVGKKVFLCRMWGHHWVEPEEMGIQ